MQVELEMPNTDRRRTYVRASTGTSSEPSHLQSVDFVRFSGDISSPQRPHNGEPPISIEKAIIDDPFLGLKDDCISQGIYSIEDIGLGLEFALRKFQVYQFIWDLDLVGSTWKVQPLKLIEHGFPGARVQEDLLNYVTAMLGKDYQTAEGMEMEGIVEILAAGMTIEVVERFQSKRFDLIKVKREVECKELWTVTAALSSPKLP